MTNTIEILMCASCGHTQYTQIALIHGVKVFYFKCECCGHINKKDN